MASLPYDAPAVRPALDAKNVSYGNNSLFKGASNSPAVDDDDSNVTLSPWVHESTPVVIAIAALLIQLGIFGTGIWLAVDPVILPSSKYVFGGVSLKSFNVLITVLGSIVSGVAGAAITVGSRSHLSMSLVKGGVTLKEYERWFAIGNGATVSLTSTNGVLPLAMFLLSAAASGAINGVFAAGADRTTSNLINVPYPSVPDAQAAIASLGLYNRQDFEGYLYDFRQNGLLQRPPNATVTDVDGIASVVGVGTVPSIFEISTLTSRILLDNGPGVALEQKVRRVIGQATGNEYLFSAPTAQATFTCDSGAMTLTSTATPVTGFLSYSVNDPTCGATTGVFSSTADTLEVAAISCYRNSRAYVGYFAINGQSGAFTPLASCVGNVNVGQVDNILYWDSQVGRPSSYNLSMPVTLVSPVDYSSLAVDTLNANWISTFGVRGSSGLSELLGTPKFTQDVSLLTGRAYLETIEVLTNGLMAMTMAKLINSAGIFGNYFSGTGMTMGTSAYPTRATSPSIIIGPSGLNKLWLVIFGLTLATLVQALLLVIKYRPTPLNPLDPVSVLLVAQNSPPTHLADGGCLGSRDQIRSKNELITYRAVNAVHLAFVWGASFYEPPVVGRMYGTTSTGKVKSS